MKIFSDNILYNFIKKETLPQVFSFAFLLRMPISKNICKRLLLRIVTTSHCLLLKAKWKTYQVKIQISHENISILSLPYLPYLPCLPYLFHFSRPLELRTGEYISFSFIWAKLVCVCSFKNAFLILSSKQRMLRIYYLQILYHHF